MSVSRNLLRTLSVLGVATYLLASCGGGSDRPSNITGTGGGGSGGTAGADGGGGAAGSGGTGLTGFGGKVDGGQDAPDDVSSDAPVDADSDAGDAGVVGAPVVTVTSPSAAIDPSNDTVVVGNQLDALCTAVASTETGAQPVDTSSIKIAVLDAAGSVVDEFAGKATANADEYTASFVLSGVPNGKFSVRCTANDTSTPAKTGSSVISTFVDHGPNIIVTTPAPNSAYALAGAVPFVFKVSPAPLDTTDPEAAVASVKLNANGVDIPATPDPNVTDGYKVAVNFADTTKFPVAPSGSVPVVIEGTNSRTPTAAKKTNSYNFVVDGAGPVITIKSPKNQDIIGGKVTLSFSVADLLSGVDQKTVSVELNQVQNLYSNTVNWTNTGDDYTFTFDSANVSGSKVQITVNVTASDLVGNKSAGTSVVLYLDNYGPIVDLDAGNVRLARKAGTKLECSESFDPLGFLAANDGDKVTPFKHFRAMVWDRTNTVSGQTVFYYSTVDQTSVYLYLQPDGPTVPLLINNDTDPECDALSTIVGGKAIPSLQLKAVPPAGAAFYQNDGISTSPAIPQTPSPYCDLGVETTPPTKLCADKSDMNIVVKHTLTGIEPVVYGIGQMTGDECTGTGWELSSQLSQATQKEGWFCLAATAKDKVGNVSISRPLRICYDDPNTTFQPSCWISSETPPSCTDGCTPPAGFQPFIYPPP